MKPGVPFVVCLAAGLLLRLVDLGEQPLSAAEAAASWTAWSAAVGSHPLPPPPSSEGALLYGLQATLFWLAGSGDAAARLPVAVASMAPLLLVWRLAPVLGGPRATVLAVLLAIDPVAVGYARLADSSALTASAAWVVVLCAAAVSTAGHAPSDRRAWERRLWIAAGVFLVSGPLAWDFILPLAVLLAVLPAWGAMPLPRAAGTAAMAALLAGTVALTRWEGLQLVSSSATRWVESWVSTGTPPAEAWTSLLRLELLPIVLGAAGLLTGALFRDHGTGQLPRAGILSPTGFVLLAVWTLWGGVLSIRPGSSIGLWLLIQPPLFLGTAHFVARAARPPRPAAVAASALAVIYIAGAAVRVASGDRATLFRPYADVTEPGVRHLAADLGSLPAPGGRRIEVVAPEGADPVLGWELRNLTGVRWVAAPSLEGPATARYVLRASPAAAPEAPDPDLYPVRRRFGSLEWMRLQPSGGGS